MATSTRASDDAPVRAVLGPVVAGLGMDLEDVEVRSAGRHRRISVVIDRDGGVDLDAIAEASRAVSDALDAVDVMGESPYTLEVTSPGVDRPLTLPRHWRRNAGRRVTISLADGTTVEGRIVSADDDGVDAVLDDGSTAESHARCLAWPEIASGQVQVEFRRPPEPDSGGGADEPGQPEED